MIKAYFCELLVYIIKFFIFGEFILYQISHNIFKTVIKTVINLNFFCVFFWELGLSIFIICSICFLYFWYLSICLFFLFDLNTLFRLYRLWICLVGQICHECPICNCLSISILYSLLLFLYLSYLFICLSVILSVDQFVYIRPNCLSVLSRLSFDLYRSYLWQV